jgi:hAT family C-terminal dimerisation region
MNSSFSHAVTYYTIYATLHQEPPAKKPRLDDFSDPCDPEDMGQQRNELAEYVNLKVAKDIDIMQFWKENRTLLPHLFKVACQVLCIPASSTASERVFSTAGRLIENRTSLSPETVNNLLFCTVTCRNNCSP